MYPILGYTQQAIKRDNVKFYIIFKFCRGTVKGTVKIYIIIYF